MSNFIKYFSEYVHVLKRFNAECYVQLKAYEVRLKAKKTWFNTETINSLLYAFV